MAAGSTRLIQGMLFGVSTADPVAYVGAGIALLVSAMVASALPALRAAQVDPARTLRAD